MQPEVRLPLTAPHERPATWLSLGLLLLASPAHALQPLEEFLAGARQASLDNREAALTAEQQRRDELSSIGRLMPSVGVRGVYTHSQYESVVNFSIPGFPSTGSPMVIQPQDQWDAYLQLDVPIVDLATWSRVNATKASARAARQSVRATALEVQKQVARFYYQLVGAEALRRSAERSLVVAQANHALADARRSEGVATALDVDRAAAEIERARQSIADADLSSVLARRALRTLTGITPEGDVMPTTDDLHEEEPLAGWEALAGDELPSLIVAAEQRRAAEATARAAKYALLPTLSGNFQERLTNATGFMNRNNYYTLGATLNWRLDVSLVAALRTQEVALGLARLREEKAKAAARDQIHEAWQRVRAGLVKSRAARAQAQAALAAGERSGERYALGAGTQLEVVQAQRDAFSAEVARIQADADLSYSRALLRLNTGQSLDHSRPSTAWLEGAAPEDAP